MKIIDFAKYVKEYIEMSLSELINGSGDFNMGLRYAFVEMLEMIQSLLSEEEKAKLGFDYRVEDIYPIE